MFRTLIRITVFVLVIFMTVIFIVFRGASAPVKENVFLTSHTFISETNNPWMTVSPNERLRAYTCEVNAHLCIGSMDGSTATIYYRQFSGVAYTDWSPDSRYVVFDGARADVPNASSSLFILTIKTGEVEQITDSGMISTQARWSADGKKIVYVGYEKVGKADIFLIDVQTKKVEQLTETPTIDEQYPCLSPDGLKVVYSGGETDNLDIHIKDLQTGTTPSLRTKSLFAASPLWGENSIAYLRYDMGTSSTNEYLIDPSNGKAVALTNCSSDVCGVIHAQWLDKELLVTMFGDVGDGSSDYYHLWRYFQDERGEAH